MPRFIVKHEATPPAWANISAEGDKASFGPREKASEFASAEEAMRAFEAACVKMWEKCVAADKESQKRREAREAAKEAKRVAKGEPEPEANLPMWLRGAPKAKSSAPTWLQKKMGALSNRWRGGTGRFAVEAKALDSDAAEPFELFYARSELGWLGGPKSKDGWGGRWLGARICRRPRRFWPRRRWRRR